jgi:hypothetical protein
MATETRNQSASLAEVPRSFFIDLTDSTFEQRDTGSSQTSRVRVKTRRIYEPTGSEGETASNPPVH